MLHRVCKGLHVCGSWEFHSEPKCSVIQVRTRRDGPKLAKIAKHCSLHVKESWHLGVWSCLGLRVQCIGSLRNIGYSLSHLGHLRDQNYEIPSYVFLKDYNASG